jgi:hypothetical protein
MSIKKQKQIFIKMKKNAIMDEIEKKYWENGWNWLNNCKIKNAMIELKKVTISKDHFNAIRDEIENKYWKNCWNWPKKEPMTKFKIVKN